MVMMFGARGAVWFKSATLGTAVGAMVLSGSGSAHADRGQAPGGGTNTTTHAPSTAGHSSAVANAAAPASRAAPPAATSVAVSKPAPAPAAAVSSPHSAAALIAKAGSAGPFLGLFGNGTASHPNAGLLTGNGYSYYSGNCPSGTVCDGGNAGKLFGDGGNGYNGGAGGNAGIFGTHLQSITLGLFFGIPLGFYGKAGDGGNGDLNCKTDGITCNGGNGGNSGALFGWAGNGGDVYASTGGTPGKAGNKGLLGTAGTDGITYQS